MIDLPVPIEQSGYLLYEPSAVQSGNPVLEGGWGGTSFVAPQFNGSTAVIDSYLGHRVGLWNPSVYSFAAGSASPVTPLSQASRRFTRAMLHWRPLPASSSRRPPRAAPGERRRGRPRRRTPRP